MIKTKKVNKSGGLTIPADIRLDVGIDKGSAVDIQVMGGKVIISKHTPRCMFCGNTKELIKLQNKDICPECVKEMEAKVHGR